MTGRPRASTARELTQELATVEWPEVVVPFPEHMHPDVEPVTSGTVAWTQRLRLVTTPAARARFAGLKSARLAARSYPAVGVDELQLCSDWLAWLFLFDDQGDEGAAGRDPQVWASLMGPFEAVIADPFGVGPGLPPLAAALRDVLVRTHPLCPPALWVRLRRHVAEYACSYLDEARHRARQQPPAVTTYIAHRRDSGAMGVVYDLVEAAEHVNIPVEWFDLREYQDLVLASTDIVCWDNDLASLAKELARDDVHNLVLAIHRGAGCCLQDAVEQAAAMLFARIAFYVAAEQTMELLLASSPLPPDTQAGIRRCLAGYRNWMRANHTLGAESRRYHDIEHTEPGAVPGSIESLLT